MEEERAKEVKNAAVNQDDGDDEEDQEDEDIANREIPSKCHERLTHGFLAIFELLDLSKGEYLEVSEAGVTTWEQKMLGLGCHMNLYDDLRSQLRVGPVALTVPRDDDEISEWTAPPWWSDCVRNLNPACVVTPKEPMSSFVQASVSYQT